MMLERNTQNLENIPRHSVLHSALTLLLFRMVFPNAYKYGYGLYVLSFPFQLIDRPHPQQKQPRGKPRKTALKSLFALTRTSTTSTTQPGDYRQGGWRADRDVHPISILFGTVMYLFLLLGKMVFKII